MPGQFATGTGILCEDWNARGQHAYLPRDNQPYSGKSNFLRLKMNGRYRVLRNLPDFDSESVYALRFSPDGTLIALAVANRFTVYEVKTGQSLRWVSHPPGYLLTWDFSPDSTLVYMLQLTDEPLPLWQQRIR